MMRKAYHEELDRIAESLVEMTHLAASAMSRATTALLDADVSLADSVIAADAEIDRMREQVDLLSFDLIALQQPVATETPSAKHPSVSTMVSRRLGDRAWGRSSRSSRAASMPIRTPSTCRGQRWS